MTEAAVWVTKTPVFQKLQLYIYNRIQWNWAWYAKYKWLSAGCQTDFLMRYIIASFLRPVTLNWALICCVDWFPVTWEDVPAGAVISDITGPSQVYILEWTIGKLIASFCSALVKSLVFSFFYLRLSYLFLCGKPVHVLLAKAAQVSLSHCVSSIGLYLNKSNFTQ